MKTNAYPVTVASWWCGEYEHRVIGKLPRSAYGSCLECRFWSDQGEGQGYCRRYPPTLKWEVNE